MPAESDARIPQTDLILGVVAGSVAFLALAAMGHTVSAVAALLASPFVGTLLMHWLRGGSLAE